MPDGGTLTIATGNITVEEGGISEHPFVVSGDYVRLSITDTGTGISNELQEHIFEPFFTTKEGRQGDRVGTLYGLRHSETK